jgi:hypothetical protein
MSAGERSRQGSQRLLVARICDVGEVFGDFQSHALAPSNRAYAFLANAS